MRRSMSYAGSPAASFLPATEVLDRHVTAKQSHYTDKRRWSFLTVIR